MFITVYVKYAMGLIKRYVFFILFKDNAIVSATNKQKINMKFVDMVDTGYERFFTKLVS